MLIRETLGGREEHMRTFWTFFQFFYKISLNIKSTDLDHRDLVVIFKIA